MNSQMKRVLSGIGERGLARLEALRQSKIQEILNGRTLNDPASFEQLKASRHKKIAQRKNNSA